MNKHISNIKEKAGRHKTLIQNFSYLSALQIFNMLLPLITYPYLIRILGAEVYGLVIYSQAIATYFCILIDFGFRLSATKEISIYRHDRNKLSEIVSSVYTIKLILWLLSIGILFGIVNLIPSFRDEKLLFLFSFAICFNELLFPQWYFQGVERMKYITIINLIARLIFLALIFIVVKDRADYLYVPLLNGVGAFIGGVIGVFILFLKDQIRFRFQPLSNLFWYIKQSLPLFGSNAIISIKDRFNIIFIGAFLGMKEVAIYDLAVKIMSLFMQPIDIINTAIYPKMAREKDMKFLIRATKFSFVFILVLVFVIQLFIPSIIEFLGKGLENAVTPTRLLLISPLIMVWSLAIGRNCLIVFGELRVFTLGMLYTSLVYLVLIGGAVVFGFSNYLLTFIIITILVYLFELIYRVLVAKNICNNDVNLTND